METKEPMAYIATKDCGCIVSSMVKDAIDKKVLGKLIAEWVAAGYNIEFVAHSYVLTNWHICRHGHKQQELTEQAARNAERAAQAAAEIQAGRVTQLTYSVAADGTVGGVSLNGTDAHAEMDPATLFEGTRQLLLEGYVLFTDGVTLAEEKVGMYRAHAHPTDDGTGYTFHLDCYLWEDASDTYLYDGTVEGREEEQFLTDMLNIAPLQEWHVEMVEVLPTGESSEIPTADPTE